MWLTFLGHPVMLARELPVSGGDVLFSAIAIDSDFRLKARL